MNEFEFIFDLIKMWNLSPLDLILVVFVVFYIKSEDVRIAVARAFGSDRIKQSKELYNLVDSINILTDKIDSIDDTGMILLKKSLKDDLEKDIKQGYTTAYQRECIIGRYELYKKKGGNSYIDYLLDEHKKLGVE